MANIHVHGQTMRESIPDIQHSSGIYYQNAAFHIKIDARMNTNNIKIERGVRQCDTILSKLTRTGICF